MKKGPLGAIAAVLGTLWLVNEICQINQIGPWWMLWYLSNLGFPCLIGLLFAWRGYYPRIGVILGALFGMFIEVILNFDQIDVLMLYLGALVGLMGTEEPITRQPKTQ